MKYIKINQHGVVVGGGECPDQDAEHIPVGPGERVVPGLASPGFSSVWRYVDGALVDTKQPITPPKPWMVWSNTSFSWVDPRAPSEITAAQWQAVRTRRDALLAQSDWTQLPDVPLAAKAAWADYRQQLRDITQQLDPSNIVWPKPPSAY